MPFGKFGSWGSEDEKPAAPVFRFRPKDGTDDAAKNDMARNVLSVCRVEIPKEMQEVFGPDVMAHFQPAEDAVS